MLEEQQFDDRPDKAHDQRDEEEASEGEGQVDDRLQISDCRMKHPERRET
jgi:hypothetical protein